MYELIQAGENAFYLQSPTNIGLYRDGEYAYLIDSGNDLSAGKRALGAVQSLGLTLAAVISTHQHADHIGGNALLQKRTGCKIYAGHEARLFIEHPYLNPGVLYGANPPKDLKGKFFLAQPSETEEIETAPLPDGMKILRLDGHAVGQYAVGTNDGVWYLGDAVSGKAVLEKYGISYLYDVGKYLESLDRMEEFEGKVFIPSHAEPVTDLRALIEINRAQTRKILDWTLEACQGGAIFEDILKTLFDRFNLTMNIAQYALAGATVRAYLTHLRDQDAVSLDFSENRLYWRAK